MLGVGLGVRGADDGEKGVGGRAIGKSCDNESGIERAFFLDQGGAVCKAQVSAARLRWYGVVLGA